MIDWNVSIAWIVFSLTFITSIIVPAVQTYLNNKHQLKMKELEYKQQIYTNNFNHKISIIEDFIGMVGKSLSYGRRTEYIDLGESYFKIYSYIDQEWWDKFDKLYKNIFEVESKVAAKTLFMEISKYLSEIINKELQDFQKSQHDNN